MTTAAPSPGFCALDHVIVAVRDLEAATRTYGRVFGLEPSWHGGDSGDGTAFVLFRIDNTCVELLAATGAGQVADVLRARLETDGEGLAGLAFATEDIEGAVAALDSRGLGPGPIEPGSNRDSHTGAERRWRRSILPFDRTRGLLLFPVQQDSPADALPRAASTADPASCVHALDHVVVQTTEAAAARALFGEGLGLRLAVDKEFESWGVRLMFFRVGGLTLEVAAALGGSGTLPATERDRLYGLSWRVGNVDAARDRIAAAGIDVSEVRTGRRPGTRVCTVRDGTCGVPTLLIEFEPGARA